MSMAVTTKTSNLPPKWAPIRPMLPPMTSAMTTGKKPIARVRCPPARILTEEIMTELVRAEQML